MTKLCRSVSDRPGAPAPGLFVVVALGVLLGAGVPRSVAATCTVAKEPAPYWGQTIGLVHDARIPVAVVERAIDMWTGCRGYSTSFPGIVIGHGTGRTLEVAYDRLGTDEKCGIFRGNRITLFEEALDPDGHRSPCGSLALNLAHELGHALGLRDGPHDERCRRHVMGRITPGNAYRRRVQPEECHAVRRRWSWIDPSTANLPWGAEVPPAARD